MWIWSTEEVRSTQNLMSRDPSSNTVDCGERRHAGVRGENAERNVDLE